MFQLFNSITRLLFAPESDSSVKGGTLTKDDILDELNKDDDSSDVELEEKKDDDSDELLEEDDDKNEEENDNEEDDSEKSLEDELEENLKDDDSDDEDLEVVTPVRRKEILAKYPKIFKDFPSLEKAYFRDAQFSEIYPTVKDAKTAKEDADSFQAVTDDVLSGKFERLFNAAKEGGSLEKVIDDFFPTLNKIFPQGAEHLVANITKRTIANMVQEAKTSGNDALHNAAVLLNQFIFGNSTYTPPTKMSKEENKEIKEKDDEIKSERAKLIQERFDYARETVETKVNNSYKRFISDNIDPKDQLSDYVKEVAVDKCIGEVEKILESDKRFAGIIQKMWERAEQKKFSSESVDEIRKAFLSKAKTVLPSVIKKARIDALRGMGKRVNSSNDKEEDDGEVRSEVKLKGKSSHSSGNGNNSRGRTTKDGPRPGETSYEYLMRD